MRRFPYELIVSLLAVVGITVWFVGEAQDGMPAPAGLLGHSLGVVGFVLMLSAETLYTLRKNVAWFNFGPTRWWMQAHVFAGIVGPYLVLLHTAGKFNGLAGVVALLTVVIVVSGFIGRYLYTAAPRTLDGVELGSVELQAQLAAFDRQLEALGADPGATAVQAMPQGWVAVLGRPWLRWRQRRRWRQAVQQLHLTNRAKAAQLQRLLGRRFRLQLQMHSLAAARRLLALWHAFHVPLGIALFFLAFIHVGAALYYATFLR
jgi:hypothetical protein